MSKKKVRRRHFVPHPNPALAALGVPKDIDLAKLQKTLREIDDLMDNTMDLPKAMLLIPSAAGRVLADYSKLWEIVHGMDSDLFRNHIHLWKAHNEFLRKSLTQHQNDQFEDLSWPLERHHIEIAYLLGVAAGQRGAKAA